MAERIRVEVTKADIKKARTGHPLVILNPLTEALDRQLDTYSWVAVRGQQEHLVYSFLFGVASLPIRAQRYLRKFYAGEKVGPQNFYITKETP